MAEALSDRELLSVLVGFDTTSARSNLALIDFAADYIDAAGVRIEHDVDLVQAKANLLAWKGPETTDRSGLVLCGHVDCVPATEPEWRSDPFVLTERGGRLYGRGSCDMKGFVAIALNVFREVAATGLQRPLALLLTYDEELGSVGAQHFARHHRPSTPLPRSVLIGEPTSLRVVRMHKGHLKLRLILHGRAAHSGFPHLGVNAIEPATEVLAALRALRAEFEQIRGETSAHFPETPYPSLCVARIDGGEAINVIPARCAIELGIRLLPGMESDEAVAQVRAAVEHLGLEVEWELEVINDSPPMLLPAEAEINRRLSARAGQTETVGVTFASDAGTLQRELGHECILFGPGSIDVAHRPNEFMPLDEFERARPLVADIVRGFCVDAEVGKGGP